MTKMYWKNIHKDERGYSVHLMALVAITVGVMLLVPFLGFASSALLGTQSTRGKADEGYAADSGVEHALWRLVYEPGFVNSMTSQNPTTSYNLNINNTGVVVTLTKLLPTELPNDPVSGTQVFQPSKNVTPTTATPGSSETFTYTIQIQNLTQSTQNLEELFDLLPAGFSYVAGSSSGIATSDPTVSQQGSRYELKWVFSPTLPFNGGEIKTQTFQATATPSQGVYCNEAWVKPGETNTGPTAKIIVGSPADTSCPGAAIDLTKTVVPHTVFPQDPNTFTYTITIQNVGTQAVNLEEIRDRLPPGGFTYVTGSSSGITASDPSQSLINNSRWQLIWVFSPKLPINPGEIKTLTFQADATLEPGQYCNETWLKIENLTEVYSWPTACVTVPSAFDIESDAGGVIVRANTIIAGTSVLVRSWQIE